MSILDRTLWPVTDPEMPPWVSRFRDHLLNRSTLSQITLHLSIRSRLRMRNWYATRYLRGRGVEIGAQQVPTQVSNECRVEYVDVVSNEQLIARYQLPKDDLVPLAHIIDGNDLSVYKTGELNFLIANHVLEHFDDPVGGAVEWLRVLGVGGRLFITLPNYRSNCYDWKRSPARADHLSMDYTDPIGRPARNLEHYDEFAQALNQWDDGDPRIREQSLEWTKAGDRHHFHVYDERTIKDVFSLAAKASSIGLRYVDGFLTENGFEFLVVLEKTETGGLSAWPSALEKRTASFRTLSIGTSVGLVHHVSVRAKRLWRNLAGRAVVTAPILISALLDLSSL